MPVGCASLFPYTCYAVEAVHTLEGPWTHASGRQDQVPFQLEGPTQATFSYMLPTVDSLTEDSLFLYFGGIAAEAEILLQDRYLGVHQQPFHPWVVPLSTGWLCDGPSQLVLKLRQGLGDTLLPRQFTGLFRPVYLMTRSQLAALYDLALPQVASADTVALVAPYFRPWGYAFDLYEAVFTLQHIREQGIRTIYLPFAAGPRFQALCRQMGFQAVSSLRPGTWVYPINAYPLEARTALRPIPFWLDNRGNRTPAYGDGFRWGAKSRVDLSGTDYPFLVLGLFFPFLAALLIRVISPGFWLWQVSLLRQPLLLADTGPAMSLSNSGLLFLLLIKTLLQALTLAMLMFYVARFYQWEVMNGFQEWSLLNRYFYGAESFPGLFGRSLLIFGLWLAARVAAFWSFGGAFRVKGLLQELIGMELIGAFPLVFVLPLAMGLLLFSGELWAPGLVGLLITLAGMYWLRRVYITYQSLGKQFSFSPAVKFLYICTFNLIPYIFWL